MSIRPQKPAPATPAPGKLPITELAEMKARRQPIVMVTAYDAPGGRLADEAGADLVLVGDSAAMTMLGHDSTVPATMDEMLDPHPRRHARREPAARDRRHAVRLVPGLRRGRRPQRDPLREGGRCGRREARRRRRDALARPRDRRRRDPGDGPHRAHAAVGDDARRLQGAGAFGGEGDRAASTTRARSRPPAASRSSSRPFRRPVAARITRELTIPTIGIGAGADCDGQVLVWHDLLGLYEGRTARFVKRYAEIGDTIRAALTEYAADVRERRFPEEQHTYAMPDDELALFEAAASDHREHADDRR